MDIEQKLRLIPETPGVYRFRDKNGTVIYVGKAKNLKRRVTQYFHKSSGHNGKTRVMISKIADLEYTVVDTEGDALLLENNLIKKYQPRYNILLKDSKSYPWIVVKNEPFPRVFVTRHFVKDKSLYFGPYGSAFHARALLDLINSIYKLRTCKHALTDDKINGGKYKVCLDYHLGKCLAPCVGKISAVKYNEQIDSVIRILKGDTASLIKDINVKMLNAASILDFEMAQEFKEKKEILEKHYQKSLVVNSSMINADVFSIIFDNNDAFCNFMRVKNGAIIQSLNLLLKMRIEEEQSSVLSSFMMEIYLKLGGLASPKKKVSGAEVVVDGLTGSASKIVAFDRGKEGKGVGDEEIGDDYIKEVLVPFMPDQEFEGKNIHVPLKGDKAALLELSRKNAARMKFEQLKNEAFVSPKEHSDRIIENLRKDLNMKEAPYHIECFDNSNIQGTYPVGSCVVFKNAVPSKKDYRRFNIKTVVGADDFASMKETLNRRYSRLLKENQPLPQLIIIDGGKGQVGKAMEALRELGLEDRIKLIGIAKRLEELIIPGDPYPLFLDKNSSSLKLIMQLRDEAHRFGITFHRNKRSKGQIETELSQIPGIGPVTEEKLLAKFKTMKRLREASYESIKAVTNKKIADILKNSRSGSKQ
ncbi:MAG: excinuclease ABC subunit UvrC [Bacteroidales bacterium]